jgi:excisionase family DNA binding protein
MQSAMIEKTFCTTSEAAALLGVSVGTVQLWVESGLLQAWKTAGGHRRVLRDSVEGLLRKKPGAARDTAPGAVAASTVRRLQVLVVEDNPNLLRLYEANMSLWRMAPEVMVIDSAVEALLMIGRSSPDLLITDLHMPGMDGFAMLKVLSKAPEIANTQIVVVSGLDAAQIDAQGGVPEGVEVLPKPIPFGRLMAIANSIVSNRGFYMPPGV